MRAPKAVAAPGMPAVKHTDAGQKSTSEPSEDDVTVHRPLYDGGVTPVIETIESAAMDVEQPRHVTVNDDHAEAMPVITNDV